MTPLLMPITGRRRTPLGLRYLGAAADVAIGTTNPGSGNIFTGGLADAPQARDIVFLAAADDGAMPATPSGFTSLVTVSETTQWGSYLRVSYKILTGPWTGATSGATSWAVSCWRGIDLSTPIDVTTQTAAHAGTIQANPPSITPVTAGAVILCFGHAGQNPIPSFSNWSPLTAATSDSGVAAGYSSIIATAYHAGWTSGAYDPAAWTATGGSGSRSATSVSIVLRPAT